MTEKQVVKKEQATAVAEFDTSMFEADASAGIQNVSILLVFAQQQCE